VDLGEGDGDDDGVDIDVLMEMASPYTKEEW
jgi:hypothetical protein